MGEYSLHDPITMGALELRNRFVMAPMTRSRANRDGVLPASAARYYGQRVSAGLIVTEGVCISPVAVGNPQVPGLWTAEQIAAWRAVTAAVHAGGGTIAAQLWHTGRASHPTLQPGGLPQVAPSPIAISGETFARDGRTPHTVPRALETPEIPVIVAQYARAAANAFEAGFDAVELHGANGYLIDQFLQDNANTRTDRYGGSIENRARFLAEVVAEVGAVAGAGRVGVRLSPSSTFQDMADSDPRALFAHVFGLLDEAGIAFLHIVEPGVSGDRTVARDADTIDAAWARRYFRGPIVAAGNFEPTTAAEAVGTGHADAIAFGRAFLANPDLPARVIAGAELTPADPATFYGGGDEGYADYPTAAGI
jgi:N-ethylmaleimide reductase